MFRKKSLTGPPRIYTYLWDCWTKQMDEESPRVDWSRVTKTVHRKPEVAGYSDFSGRGMLLLHFACALHPPLEPIVEILNANKRATNFRGHTGLIPLHIACGRNASPAVVRRLIQEDPGSLTITDNEDQTAVHYACRGDVDPQILYLLLSERPKLASLPFDDSNAGLRTKPRLHGANSPLTILYQERGMDYSILPDGSRSWSSHQWSKITYWLLAAHFGTLVARNGQTLSILHAALAQNCPADIIKLVLHSTSPDFCAVRDVRGSLPLHYAMKAKALRHSTIISTLVDLFPQAASCTDAFSRLPLHEGLKSGKTWSDGMGDVFKHYPAAVTINDKQTGSPAVILAAKYSDLETTFLLLQAYPQVVMSLTGNTE